MCIRDHKEGASLRIHLSPGSSAREVTGVKNEALAVRLRARPVEGKANKELIRFIAELLGAPPSSIRILFGATSRDKTLLITGTDAEAVRTKLAVHISR